MEGTLELANLKGEISLSVSGSAGQPSTGSSIVHTDHTSARTVTSLGKQCLVEPLKVAPFSQLRVYKHLTSVQSQVEQAGWPNYVTARLPQKESVQIKGRPSLYSG